MARSVKRPRRPPRPPRKPPRPDTPKLPKRPRPKPWRPRPRKTLPNELTRYLSANPGIADAIRWSSAAASNWQRYPSWTPAQKAQLADVYFRIRKQRFQGLSATPALTYLSTGLWEGLTAGVGLGVDEATSWDYFLAYVANSLVVEIARLVPWSLRNYSSSELALLLTSNGLFQYTPNAGSHLAMSGATPGDPVRIFRFLTANSFVSTTRRGTVGQLVDWCRSNMRHYLGGLDAAGAQAHWQYNGYPPVERVIAGTTHPQYGFAHWTGGCWGTTAFLKNVLRTANIPVQKARADGHATPQVVSDNLYLSHGDDPYSRLLTTTPPIPIDELLIDQATYTSWFDANLPAQVQQDNVGRRCTELAMQYVTDWVLQLRCNDLRQGVTNDALSSVYNDNSLGLGKFYTVGQLQAMNLWGRIDAKIAAKGGCSVIFPSPMTAAITAPPPGASVSGVVTVGMAVSGQTTPMNRFRLELNGNLLADRTVTGLTLSEYWLSTDWTNGPATLVLTVTNGAGNSATASRMVTIANAIAAAITTPPSGATVSGTVVVRMEVSGHTLPLNQFRLDVDGMPVFNQAVAGLSATYSWSTATVANGPHSLTLRITDAVGKTASASVSVDVAN